MKRKYVAIVNGERLGPEMTGEGPGGTRMEILPQDRHRFDVRHGDAHHKAYVREIPGRGYEIWIGRYRFHVTVQDEQQEKLSSYIQSSQKAATGMVVRAPMPGLVKEISVAAGDTVVKGQRLLILEAMKMENEITSPLEGTVSRCTLTAGKNVEKDQELLQISTPS